MAQNASRCSPNQHYPKSLSYPQKESFTGIGCVENYPDEHMTKAGWFIQG